MTLGIEREIVDEDEKVDLVLQEIQKNGQDKIKETELLSIGLFCGLNKKETLFSTFGEVHDLMAVKQRGQKKRAVDT